MHGTRFLARWKAWAQCDTRVVYRIANAMYGRAPLAGGEFCGRNHPFSPWRAGNHLRPRGGCVYCQLQTEKIILVCFISIIYALLFLHICVRLSLNFGLFHGELVMCRRHRVKSSPFGRNFSPPKVHLFSVCPLLVSVSQTGSNFVSKKYLFFALKHLFSNFLSVHRICYAIYYPRVALCPCFPAREEPGTSITQLILTQTHR